MTPNHFTRRFRSTLTKRSRLITVSLALGLACSVGGATSDSSKQPDSSQQTDSSKQPEKNKCSADMSKCCKTNPKTCAIVLLGLGSASHQ